MLAHHQPRRIMVFIDGSNLFHCLREDFPGKRLDLGKLVKKLAQDKDLIRTYYYNARRSNTPEPFYTALSWIDFLECRFGKLVPRQRKVTCPHCHKQFQTPTYEQKGVDMRLGLDLVTGALRNLYDVAILVSGDADLVEPVRLVKETGKTVVNAFVKQGWAEDLRNVCDVKVLLDEQFLLDCWLTR